jgi:hypothetical protein
MSSPLAVDCRNQQRRRVLSVRCLAADAGSIAAVVWSQMSLIGP